MDWTLLFAFVGVFAVGAYLGYKINDWFFRTTFNEMMAQAGVNDVNINKFISHWAPILEENGQPENPQVQVRIEQVNDDLFCYEKATDRFLGQAKTREELIDVLTERLGPVSLFIQPEDGADYIKESSK